jgi:two-component system, NtrC family, C4-dicarboxylate transport response regulator DctD
MTAQVILVDDEPHVRVACSQALGLAGLSVETFASAEGALERIDTTWPGILVTDIKMPGMDGLALLRRTLEIDRDLPVIMVTGHGDIPMAIGAIRAGAYEFIEKPFAPDALVKAVKRALEMRRLVIENRSLQSRLAGGGIEHTIIGSSEAARALRSKIMAFAGTEADVLIMGETGVGKELVARTLHHHSARRSKRFVAINCGAIPEAIIESELFGHEAGAFTGASKRRIGKFEYAHGGTLFLDEIESMPRELQVRLLRVLQERMIERVGSNVPIAVDVRIMTACKANLREECAAGRFREDLYFRLNVLSIEIPSLRDRMEDVPLLFHWFVSQSAERGNRPCPPMDAHTLTLILQHDWPGNVRELQNAAIRHAMGLDLGIGGASGAMGSTLADRMAYLEKQLVHHELQRNGGDLKTTYESLGVSRKTLYDKLRKYGLGRPPADDE